MSNLLQWLLEDQYDKELADGLKWEDRVPEEKAEAMDAFLTKFATFHRLNGGFEESRFTDIMKRNLTISYIPDDDEIGMEMKKIKGKYVPFLSGLSPEYEYTIIMCFDDVPSKYPYFEPELVKRFIFKGDLEEFPPELEQFVNLETINWESQSLVIPPWIGKFQKLWDLYLAIHDSITFHDNILKLSNLYSITVNFHHDCRPKDSHLEIKYIPDLKPLYEQNLHDVEIYPRYRACLLPESAKYLFESQSHPLYPGYEEEKKQYLQNMEL